MTTHILGINAYHGDVSAVLVSDGELVAAVEEERFRRIKHCAGFPSRSIEACLALAAIEPGDVDHFAISRDPRAHVLRKILFALTHRPGKALVRDRLKNREKLHDVPGELASVLELPREHVTKRLHWVEHHPAHLASAFFVSPFEDAAVCAIDGFGDFVSTSTATGRGAELSILGRTFFPHSLGLLYLAVTQYLGFPSYGDEYKVMGLAPYGEPRFVDALERLLTLEPRGGFKLILPYFRHASEGVEMTWDEGAPTIGPVFTDALAELLGPQRSPDEDVTRRHQDVAASVQIVFENAYLHVLNELHERTGSRALCLAGGCAMNSVANGKIRERTPFEEVFVQPAAGDNGTALGAAFWVWNQILRRPRTFRMDHGYWGPSFERSEIETALRARRAELDVLCHQETLAHTELCHWAAKRVAAGKVVGWFQGRMEWGARALGNRSILADPRRQDMREILNAKIKFREPFRPFAPAILEERLDDYFDDAAPDPFMLHVRPIREAKRAVLPAVTHVDGSGRLQSVSRSSNPLFWDLLRAFEAETGVPVLLNTSFNENEPIVNLPEEALDCFLRTDMDVLVLGGHVLEKHDTAARSEPVAVTSSQGH